MDGWMDGWIDRLPVGVRYEDKVDRHEVIKKFSLMYNDPGLEMRN
jgi:hypothetical protein